MYMKFPLTRRGAKQEKVGIFYAASIKKSEIIKINKMRAWKRKIKVKKQHKESMTNII